MATHLRERQGSRTPVTLVSGHPILEVKWADYGNFTGCKVLPCIPTHDVTAAAVGRENEFPHTPASSRSKSHERGKRNRLETATIGQPMSDPILKARAMKRELPEAEQQLALILPLPTTAIRRKRLVRPCTRARARWWFDEMRRVVDQGLDFRATGVR